MKKEFILEIILLITIVVIANIAINHKNAGLDNIPASVIQQTTCERNNGIWNSNTQECYFQ